MTYALDTDTCISHLRVRGAHAISARLRSQHAGEIALPCVVVSELLYGGFRAKDPQSLVASRAFCNSFQWLPFDARVTELHAQLRADLMSRNAQIGPYNSIIAATVLANDLILVTHNIREFSRVANLRLEDWHTP